MPAGSPNYFLSDQYAYDQQNPAQLLNQQSTAQPSSSAGNAAQAFLTVLNGYNKYQASKAQRALLFGAADEEYRSAGAKAMLIKKAGAQVLGEATTNFAANGVDVNSGSALQARETITRNAEADAIETLIQGKLNSMALKYQGKETQRAGMMAFKQSFLQAGAGMM